MRSNEPFELRAALVSGKGQCSDWTVAVVNGHGKAKPDAELRGLIEELLPGSGKPRASTHKKRRIRRVRFPLCRHRRREGGHRLRSEEGHRADIHPTPT